jgi:hypothetical protein
MNDDLAALQSVRSWGRETGRHDERLTHRKEKVCLKPLPGGFWGRPCREPPATTGATPPSLQHARGAHPRTGPPVHRREQRQGPRPRGSEIGATGAGPRGSGAQRRGCRLAGRIARPRPPFPRPWVPSADASAIPTLAATGRSPTGTAATSVAAGDSMANTTSGLGTTSAPAVSPITMAASAEEPASGACSPEAGDARAPCGETPCERVG